MNDDLAIMGLKDIRDYLIECHYNVEAIEYAIKSLEDKNNEGKMTNQEAIEKIINPIIKAFNQDLDRYVPTDAMKVQEKNDNNRYGEHCEFFVVDEVYKVIEKIADNILKGE